MKALRNAIFIALLSFTLSASAAPVSEIYRSLIPEQGGSYNIGTTTPSNRFWARLFVNNASTTALSAQSGIQVGSTATTSIFGNNATSTFSNGINLPTGGCFAQNGNCISGSGGGGSGTVTSVDIASANGSLTVGGGPITTSGTLTAILNLANSNIWTALQRFNFASSTLFSSLNGITIGTTATTTIRGDVATSTFSGGILTNKGFDGVFATLKQILLGDGSATSTFTGGATTTTTGGFSSVGLNSSNGITLTAGNLNITSGATSTATNGYNITAGCYAVGGSCISGSGGGGTVTSVDIASANGSLTVGGGPITTTGTLTAVLNLGNSNVWTALQRFISASSTRFSALGPLTVGNTSTTTIQGDAATSTFSGGISSSKGFDGVFATLRAFQIGIGTASTTFTPASLTTDRNITIPDNSGTLAVAATAPITLSTGISGGTIACNTASGIAAGCLSSGDFSTFSAKQDALSFSGGLTNTAGTVTCDSAVGMTKGCITLSNTNVFTGQLQASSTALFGGVVTHYAPTILQDFTGVNATTTNATTTRLAIISITGSTQCLQANTNGLVTGTGSACGAGGGSSFGQAFEINTAGFLAPTTTIKILANGGLVSQASSTFVGGITVVGGATSTDATTTNLAVSGASRLTTLFVSGLSSLANFTGLQSTTTQATTTNFAISSVLSTLLGTNATGGVIPTTVSSPLGYSAGVLNCATCALTGTTISAGTGLSGGGDLSANRTITLDLTATNIWSGLQTFTNTGTSTSAGGHFSSKGFDGKWASLNQLLLGSGSATSTFTGGATTTTSGGFQASGLGSSNGLTVSGGNIQVTSSATSTFNNGLNLTAGCFSIAGSCVGGSGGGGSGTVNSGTAPQVAFYAANGTAVSSAGVNGGLNWDNTLGRLGIGTSSPYTALGVAGQIVANNIFATSSAATSTFIGGVNMASTTAVSTDFSYEVGSGNTYINGLNAGLLTFDNDAGVVAAMNLPFASTTAAAGTVESYGFLSNSSTTMTVYSEHNGSGGVQNQRVGIATTSPWLPFSVQGRVVLNGLTTSSGLQTGILCVNAFNEVINESVACVASGEMYKQNIKDLSKLTTTMSKVMAIKPASFSFKTAYLGQKKTDRNLNGEQISFLAGNVAQVDPRLAGIAPEPFVLDGVTYPAGTPNNVKDRALLATLWEGVREFYTDFLKLVDRMTGAETKINSLQTQVNALDARLKKLEK